VCETERGGEGVKFEIKKKKKRKRTDVREGGFYFQKSGQGKHGVCRTARGKGGRGRCRATRDHLGGGGERKVPTPGELGRWGM